MLRWMTPFLVAIFAIGTAAAQSPEPAKPADGPAAAKPADSPAADDRRATAKPADSPPPSSPPIARPRRSAPTAPPPPSAPSVRAASQLPPGLPRAHYKYRTTVAPAAPALRAPRPRVGGRGRDRRCCSRRSASVPYAPRVFGTPLLPGSSTLPGYYGTSHSYSYDGPYYGGPYTPLLESPALRLRRLRVLLAARSATRDGPSTWQGHREKPRQQGRPPTRSRPIWSPCSSP